MTTRTRTQPHANMRTRICIFAILCSLCSLLFNPPAQAAELVTATVTLTNLPAGLSSNITVNGSTRYWSNSPVGVLSTTIQTTNTIAMSATNLLNHLTAFPPDVGWYFSQTSPTNVTIRARVGQTLTVTLAPAPGWAVVTYVTQQVTTPTWTVRVPITVEAASNQVNIASLLVKGISDSSTNAFATNSTAGSNFLTKGASPTQKIISPVQFDGRLGIGGSLNATNGFDSGRTNINPVTSNLVNYGNAIRSEGPGGNSLQAGSNAMAQGSRSVAIGNGARATNADTVAIGTSAEATNQNSVAVGNSASARGTYSVVVGDSSLVSTNYSVAVGQGTKAQGYGTVAIGSATEANADFGIAIGVVDQGVTPGSYLGIAIGNSSSAQAQRAMALGSGAVAAHSNSVALGPKDDQATAVTTTTTNQIVLGTSRIRVYSPGLYESPASTNSQFAGTNLARGSWSFPRFDLNTLAAGNNISVPFGTNLFIRCNSGPASAATICGIIGGATSGGLDGQVVHVFNDTGFTLTFAVNTVDPVSANRINTPTGGDIGVQDQGWAELKYDSTDAKWKLVSTYPVTASATNAIAFSDGSATNLNVYQTASKVALTANALPTNGTNTFSVTGTNGTVVAGVSSNSTSFVRPLTGRTENPWQVETTNGAATTFVRTNHTLVASNLVMTPASLAGVPGQTEVGVAYRLFSQTNSVTVTNTTGATSLTTNSLWGTNIIAANALQPGMTIHVNCQGYLTSVSATTCEVGVRMNNGLVIGTNLISLATSLVNDYWFLDFYITVRSTGGSGTVMGIGSFAVPTSSGAGVAVSPRRLQSGLFPTIATVDTTTAQVLDVYIKPGAATHGITCAIATAEIIP